MIIIIFLIYFNDNQSYITRFASHIARTDSKQPPNNKAQFINVWRFDLVVKVEAFLPATLRVAFGACKAGTQRSG